MTRQSVINDYGIPPQRVTAVGGGLSLGALPELPTRRPAAPLTVLFIGAELRRKGGDVLLQAFARTRAELPGARLLCLTRGPIPPELPMDGVEVIAPTWDREVILGLFRRADLFALPSRLETWGDVLLEAMAFGLPCIGVSGQAMEEIVEHERTGLIVPPDDVPALAAAMTRLLRDPALRQTWGSAGRQRVETLFTWDKVVDRFAPVIERASQR
ncbi:MAG: glycosyltransferase family 4 protein, partial [Chloroflexi bacterium]|nr:glycosyltransferase family 4 protein [Chloroflexota bacterium]